MWSHPNVCFGCSITASLMCCAPATTIGQFLPQLKPGREQACWRDPADLVPSENHTFRKTWMSSTVTFTLRINWNSGVAVLLICSFAHLHFFPFTMTWSGRWIKRPGLIFIPEEEGSLLDLPNLGLYLARASNFSTERSPNCSSIPWKRNGVNNHAVDSEGVNFGF